MRNSIDFADLLADMAPILCESTAFSFRDGWVNRHPDSSSIYPSQNLNRVDHFGVRGEGQPADLEELAAHFSSADNAFFHLSEFPLAPAFRAMFDGLGWKKQRAEMSLLWREPDPAAAQSPFIRPAEGLAEATELGSPVRMARLFGHPGAHLLVWDNGFGVDGFAALYHLGDTAYLGDAMTREGCRGRGIQSALIQYRLRLAADLGCRDVLVETYDWLPSSFANLRRTGFQEVMRREIYRIATPKRSP
jgi:GNAT superfamily N-acetyltransferase